MRNITKVFALVLCVCMVMSLIACGNAAGNAQITTEPTEKTWPIPTASEGPNENQCAADVTIEETEYPTEEFVPETTAHEALIEETTPTETYLEDSQPPAEEELGDIQIPFPED